MDLQDYTKFVDSVTSDASKDNAEMIKVIKGLDANGISVSRLLTSCIGLAGEVGEYNDIIKKVIFQGKVLDEALMSHLKKELGDVVWYFAQACLAVGEDPYTILKMNHEKLTKRYESGTFKVDESENRKSGDV